MKPILITLIISLLIGNNILLYAQNETVKPSIIITGTYLGETPPLRDLPRITDAEWQAMVDKANEKILNPKLRYRSYPFADIALPKGPDPVWQRLMGANRDSRAPLINFTGQNSPYYPSDANGTIGPNHYMQTVNSTYAIYSRTGTIMAGPSPLNSLFTGVTGATCNDGDPIILYDEQASRWLVAEFSICGTNDYMLIAVSTTNDPTGTWHKYSFDVADVPDYEKFGIWQDGYYMATNTYSGTDMYVFERSQMLNGLTARGVGFDNPNRPSTIDGFVCVPPVDNDGAFAPAGAPGIFIAFNDDGIGGGIDQLWIYELDVDWTTTSNSTFSRVQQINVASFDSNFGNNWDNIKQPVTTQELDAIPQVIMNPPQYRNFGSYQTIVCCHTVDVDATDHAGIRWYELRRTTGTWSVRQQGTYAPDEHSRWMGSMMLNGNNEIGLGYSISSTTVYPGIRYCGQSAASYAAANGTLDVAEQIIRTGTTYQSSYNRWGDYSGMSVDPSDDETFWYTTQYAVTASRATRIASFQIGPVPLEADFIANNTNPQVNTQVNFTDLSTGTVISRNWSFAPNTVTYLNGTSASSQNPQVSFNSSGDYSVTLVITDGTSYDTTTKVNYIHAFMEGLWIGGTSTNWYSASNWGGGIIPGAGTDVVIHTANPNWPEFSGNFIIGTQCQNLTISGAAQASIAGDLTISPGATLTFTGNGILSLSGNWINHGTFIPGNGTIEFVGSGSSSVSAGDITDINNYLMTTFPKAMTQLSSPITGPSGDDGNSVIPIGFSFNYLGTNYTQTRISTNGWLALDQSGTANGYLNESLFNTAEPNTTLAAWWDNLVDDGTSVVSYKTEGNAPNRVFTAEWKSILTYTNPAKARISFQIKLFETSNVIEFHYGSYVNGKHNTAEGASIGIEDGTGGSGHFIEATSGSTSTEITTLVTPDDWPATNFRFSRPSFSEIFYNVLLNKNSNNTNFDVNTTVNGIFTVSAGSTFTVPTDKQVTVN